MIVLLHGDLLEAKADVLVNPVNTKGVMGKGIARQFKQRFPRMYESYRRACLRGEVYIKIINGKLKYKPHVYKQDDFLIINLPTKTDWRLPSRYEYVVAGLRWIKVNFDKLSKFLGRPIETIAMPLLGCGCGGLNKQRVFEIIVKELYNLPCDIYIYSLNKDDLLASKAF